MAIKEFFEALDDYKVANKNRKEHPMNFIGASIRVHAAKGGVPKSYWRLVNEVLQNNP